MGILKYFSVFLIGVGSGVALDLAEDGPKVAQPNSPPISDKPPQSNFQKNGATLQNAGLVEPDKQETLTQELELKVLKTALKPQARAKTASVESAKATKAPKVATPEPQTLYVTARRVNLRTGASTRHAILAQLNYGALATEISRNKGWVQINATVDSKSVTGWMSGKYLSTKPAARDPVLSNRASVTKRKIAVPTSAQKTSARKTLIQRSIAAYSGSCPCPYNRDRGGRRCGKRSAWSRPGGYSPLCYDSDITEARLKTYFARNRGATD